MGKDIKGINIEIGASTTQFNKAMKDMSSVTRTTQNELNAINKSLKFDPKNVDLLKQKEELLAKQIEDVRTKVEKMKAAKEKADKEMANGTEVNQEQYRVLVREISAAEGQLKSLIRQNDKFGNSARELGGKIEGIGKKGMAVSGAIIGIGTAAVGAMSAAAEETREYREDMNKLETAFKTGGFTVDAAKKSYEDFYTILGETDRSVEAVNHLARFVTTEQDLAKWSDIAAGVTATFGDSLPIEGLTEAANETVKVGKVTGVLADALNWAGINEDKFNESLAKCNSEQERSELITSTLDGLYKDAATTYKELNADIIANRKATSEANDQLAKLGESSEGVNTKLKEAKNTITAAVLPTIGKLADKVSDLDEGQIMLLGGIAAIGAVVPTVITGAGTLITAVGVLKATYDKLTASATAASIATKAIPFIGVAATAITLIGAVTALASATDEETEKTRELHEASVKRYEDYQKNKQAAQEQAEASLSEISHIESLKDELIELADENGRVADGDKARAEFILGQLNSALGTEYTMTGNIIRNYQNLSAEIDNLIIKKKAEILLSSMEGSYKNAIKEKEKEASILRERTEAYEQAVKAYEDYQKKVDEAAKQGLYYEMQQGQKLTELKGAIEQAKEAMEKSSDAMGKYESDIKAYESAYASITEDGGKAFVASWKDRTTVLTAEQKKAGKSYEDAVVKLADYTKKYKQGVEGYTEAGRKELEDHVAELKTEAEKIGVSINEGMVVGLEDTEEVKTAVSTLCDLIPQWAKDCLGINSPAKVAIPIGEAIPEGIGVGITKDMSAEEALEKKCKNLENILKDYTEVFDLNIKLAESEHNLFLAQNPEASPIQKLAKQEEMLNKQYEEQGKKVQAVNDALWHQIQLTGEESVESKKLLIQLNEEKKAYMELADAIAEVNKEKASYSGGGSSYVAGGSPESKYASYHVQYGAMLKSQGVSQEAIDAAARKVSGYAGERSINVNNYISGVTADTPHKVSQETVKSMNNMAMQGVL